MTRSPFAPPLLLALALSGCASKMSGVGGTDGYACKAPEGTICTSVSGVYANATHALPMNANAPETKAKHAAPLNYGATSIAPRGPMASGSAIRSAIRSTPRVLRLWIAPWEDADGDLHEEALVHVVVDSGRWLIEHVRPAARSRVDAVAPPVAAAPAAVPTPASAPDESTPGPTRFPLPPTGPSSGAGSSATER